MADNYNRPYIDSSVWIAWIKGEVVKGINRKEIFDHILRQAQAGNYQLFTSTITLAEVHKVKGSALSLSDEQDEAILSFFEHDFIRLIEVDREIGENANRICRNTKLKTTGGTLRPFDALHLACALRANCDYLLYWDGDFDNCHHPNISFANPTKLGQSAMDIDH